MNKSFAFIAIASLSLSACEQTDGDGAAAAWASRYAPLPSVPTLLQGATVLTGTGERLENADVAMRDGKIVAVGAAIDAADMLVVDASGLWITPGIIDVHSHLGVYSSPSVAAHSDGNEMSEPVTAQVWAEHAVWPQDPAPHHWAAK